MKKLLKNYSEEIALSIVIIFILGLNFVFFKSKYDCYKDPVCRKKLIEDKLRKHKIEFEIKHGVQYDQKCKD